MAHRTTTRPFVAWKVMSVLPLSGVIENVWKNEGAPAVDDMLAEMATAGFRATDLGDWGFITADYLERFPQDGIQMMGAFVEVPAHSPEAAN